jgi:hypothetical protein
MVAILNVGVVNNLKGDHGPPKDQIGLILVHKNNQKYNLQLISISVAWNILKKAEF